MPTPGVLKRPPAATVSGRRNIAAVLWLAARQGREDGANGGNREVKELNVSTIGNEDEDVSLIFMSYLLVLLHFLRSQLFDLPMSVASRALT